MCHPAYGRHLFVDNLETLKRSQRSTQPAYNKLLFNAYDKRIPSHERILEELTQGSAGTMAVYCFPTDPIYRRAQDKRTVIHAVPGVKSEIRAALRRLTQDIH